MPAFKKRHVRFIVVAMSIVREDDLHSSRQAKPCNDNAFRREGAVAEFQRDVNYIERMIVRRTLKTKIAAWNPPELFPAVSAFEIGP